MYGKGIVEPPEGANVINVELTEEMCEAIVKELKEKNYDIFIAAASADYSPLKREAAKIPSKQESLVVHLKPTPKIIEEAMRVNQEIFSGAFKAESNISEDILIKRAYKRLKEVGLDLIVDNDVGKSNCGFGFNTNEVYIIDTDKKIVHAPLNTKHKIAAKILDIIVNKIGEKVTK